MKDKLSRKIEATMNTALRNSGVLPRPEHAVRQLEKQRIAMHRRVAQAIRQPAARKSLPGQSQLFD